MIPYPFDFPARAADALLRGPKIQAPKGARFTCK
jgi:hypothetical protein